MVYVGDGKWRREAKQQVKCWKIIKNIDHCAHCALFVFVFNAEVLSKTTIIS
jgi:hypothetical protein